MLSSRTYGLASRRWLGKLARSVPSPRRPASGARNALLGLSSPTSGNLDHDLRGLYPLTDRLRTLAQPQTSLGCFESLTMRLPGQRRPPHRTRTPSISWEDSMSVSCARVGTAGGTGAACSETSPAASGFIPRKASERLTC